MTFHPGHVLTDIADIQRLPPGSIISWSSDDWINEPGDDLTEEVAVTRQKEPGGPITVHNTRVYYQDDPYCVVTPPYTVVRVGRPKP
ncbi:hypothetical protein [Nocardia carnea]|uniref:hypothetical protein n=1 Tax=Nocardia carnea TaxID=37328 RepID=UPI0024589F9F|nr:hypothetical protein [Nocardia carnea]